MSLLRFGRLTVEATHEDKIYFPKSKLTKGDLINYYRDIAPIMVTYMKDRPVNMHRFPDGIAGKDFYHKDVPDYFPSWIQTTKIKRIDVGGSITQVVCNNAATLVYLANQACITPHLWLSRIDKLHYPDRLIVDLDPPKNGFRLACRVAKQLKDMFESGGMRPFVMTTGSKGLHVLVPLDRAATFDAARSFARQLVEIVAATDPKHITCEVRKEKRVGKLFLDVGRNAYAQTAVSPYAVRAKEHAPIATPLHWEELDEKSISPQKYTIANIFKRLERVGDPWKGMSRFASSISKAHKKLDALL